jgi:hypothetical protein
MFRRGLVGLRRCHDWLRSWIDALHLEIDWLPILWSGIALAFCLFVLVPTDRYYNEYAEHPKEAAQNKASNGADDDRIADYTWWVAVFTGVLGISTIGLWFVTWQSVRHAKADSVRQARQLRVSNIAAIRAATAGEKTIERMDKTAAHQLRAYVFVHRTALELTKKAQSAGTIGGLFPIPRYPTGRVSYAYENTGQTPAKNVRVAVRARWVATGTHVDVSDVGPLRLIGPLGPKSIFTGELDIENSPDNAAFIRAMTEDGARELHLFGRIEYSSEFAENCWTTFHCAIGGAIGYDRILHAIEPGNDYR